MQQPRDVIPFRPQPLPVQYFVATMPFPFGMACTAITRVWAPGDTYQCKLCAECSADHDRGVCQVVVSRAVAHDDAMLFSTRGMTRNVGPRLSLCQ